MQALSTESYKGVRDFYPDQMRIQNYLLDTMHRVVRRFGYMQYDASLLEDADLYRAKSGSELVNEQTYTFTDRGGREVTLRPEMTPTLARMIAGQRKTLSMPARWYSIPNCFRYEKPQRGRLREFWQLNVDMFGSESLYADAETITIAYSLLIEYGAKPEMFLIKINNRKIMRELLQNICNLDVDAEYGVSKLIDRKHKISEQEFNNQLKSLCNDFAVEQIQNFLKVQKIDELNENLRGALGVDELIQVFKTLDSIGITNYIFDPTLMRGLDYYTGVVFEVFDSGNENNRSLFGGGRYDYLVDMFGCESVTATGFGMSDIVVQKFLETYDLVPDIQSSLDLVICTLDVDSIDFAMNMAQNLRNNGITTLVDFSEKKLGAKIGSANDNGARYLICIGSNEVASGMVTVKHLSMRTETEISTDLLGDFFEKRSLST